MDLYTGNFGKFYASNSSSSASEREINAKYIYKSMSANGWTLESICGIIGNMAQESSINPARWQGGIVKDSKGYGLVQWTPSTNFRSWASINEQDELMDGQMARINWEHDNGKQFYKTTLYPLTFKQFKVSTETTLFNLGLITEKSKKAAVYYLARVFGRNYERSSAILSGGDAAEKSLNARGNVAITWYNYLAKEFNLSTVEENVTTETDQEEIIVNVDGKDMRKVTSKNVPLNVRSGAGLNYKIIGNLSYGSIVSVVTTSGTWAKIEWENGIAWCSIKYLEKYDGTQDNEEVVVDDSEDVVVVNTISAKDLIAEFYKMLGWKYEWGAAREGVVDCSGAFTYAFKQLGSWMYHGSNTMKKTYSYDDGKIGSVQLFPGMAVYKWRSPNDFHHVGLYIGAGLVIEAKGSKYGVVVSRIEDWHYAGKLKSKDGTVVNYDVTEFTPQSFVGTVNTNGTLNMRSATETISSNLVKKLSSGTEVEVLNIEVDSGWYAIKYNGMLGFVMQKYINTSGEIYDNVVEDEVTNDVSESDNNSEEDVREVTSKKLPLNVRTGAGTNYEDVGDLVYGETVVVLEEKGTWVKIKWEDGFAWCSTKYLKKV
ncbi:MAG: phage tail tip lysozyme [Candidatus Methanomethylophilaceae archaeon]|nr:phage tail tip lysozyme [Candidatus Methanomethylophilaceae archaeon]